MNDAATFPPGSTIGIMGGGQLGRMFAIAARRMGYRVHTFSPDEDTPTGQLADREVAARYDDETAVRDFARGVDVISFEFENIPVECIGWAAEHCPVRPAGRVLHICQQRLREKEFLAAAGLPLPPFAAVTSAAELAVAAERIGLPAVLKTAAFGYDGKGQRKLKPDDDLAQAWAPFESRAAVLEAFVDFECELSVIVARGLDGAMATFPVARNAHANHILDVSAVPFGDEKIERAACELARAVAAKLELAGLLAVEMFLTRGGELLINELAPRPHNSGHWSFDAAVTSQFEQQLRAVCGLPLGSTELLRPVAMANLLGDLWANGEPDWAAAAAFPEVKIHLYGKADARPGRKMGHLVAFGSSPEDAAARVRAARTALGGARDPRAVAGDPPATP
ncbi:MAG TPA: 5-(carboxyamino)imidazole ribonucleotide synthase [Chthoniobacteraceae bacterium]|nr:5-(carboxyamino)imidazole ribonucleotide synthase [Chthoniobacteraceae bacterium]